MSESKFSGSPEHFEAVRHSELQRWSNFFESAADERAFFAADRQRDRLDDARDQEQAAIDSNPEWDADFAADRRERESVLHPVTPAMLAAGESEQARLMAIIEREGITRGPKA